MNLIAFCVKLSFLKVYFSVFTKFAVLYVTSNPKKLLCANFQNIVGRDNILKIIKFHFSCLILTILRASPLGHAIVPWQRVWRGQKLNFDPSIAIYI
jgi:hypothetical protein